jgi:molybdopterin converting factor small subunit
LIRIVADVRLFTMDGDRTTDLMEIELPEGSDVLHLLEKLAVHFPNIVIIDKNKISYVLCLVENKPVTMNHVLQHGDKIIICPLMDGG